MNAKYSWAPIDNNSNEQVDRERYKTSEALIRFRGVIRI